MGDSPGSDSGSVDREVLEPRAATKAVSVSREKTACRACSSPDLISVLDLGEQPLANRFVTEEQLEWQEPDFPLHAVRCGSCGLMQLTHVVDPEVLYRNYIYESGHSAGWHNHCGALAKEISERHPKASVLDIAANDGTFLGYCRDRGMSVLGVEPARNLDTGPDIPVIEAFWPIDVGTYDVIVAQNVFGHVDDARGFLQGITQALARDGVAIIECPWVVDLIRHRRWDTIYHEHLSYWGVFPMLLAAHTAELFLKDVRYFPDLHGGTVRYYLCHAGTGLQSTGAWADLAEAEGKLEWDAFATDVQQQIGYWNGYLQNPTGRGLAGYGASAKSSTFLNALPDRPRLVGIFDDNPRKWGTYTPGWHFPVLRPTHGVMMACDELVNFAPNWDLEPKARSLGFTGSYRSIWK